MVLFQITCSKESKNMMVEKNLRITITVYKKLYPPVITWNEKNFLKQVAPVTDALEKKSFVVVTFEGVGVVFFFQAM